MTSIQQNTAHIAAAQNTEITHTHHTQTASWKGFHVQTMPKGAVNIADMAEEAALSLAHFSADKSIKQKQDEDKKIKKTKDSSEIVPGMSQYEADVFVRALSQQEHQDANTSLALVKKFFRDPTLQDAALRHAMAHIPENDSRHAQLEKALELLHEEAGAHIRAGYNIAPVEHQELSPQQARDCYRFHILNYSSYEATFKNLLQEYTPENLPHTVDFLRKALGADMQSLQPSCASAQLHEVAEGLYVIQNLSTLYTTTGKLCASTAKRFARQEPHAREVMLGILQTKDNAAITTVSLQQIMPYLTSNNPSRDAVFGRGVREIARNLPFKLFSTEEQRQKVLSVLQQSLDKAIDREEEMEE